MIFAIAAAAIGSSFQHGYNTGVVNAPQKMVEDFILKAHQERFLNSTSDPEDDKKTVSLIFSIMVSIFCIGGMIGALMTAYVADKFGRKGGLLWNNILVFIAGGLMGFSKMCQSYEMLIMGRFFIGINCGNLRT